MHVIFVSNCEAKAKKRTISVLDRYAIRASNNTWMTPITEDVLDSIHKELRRKATRLTAVACYRNYGKSEMRLQWVVGRSSAFGANGANAVATRTHKQNIEPFLRLFSLVAQLSGLCHDLGKATLDFQGSFKKIKKNLIRHELVSVFIFKALIDGYGDDWEKAWEEARKEYLRDGNPKSFLFTESRKDDKGKKNLFNLPIKDCLQSIEFIISTHHVLFGTNNTNDYIADFKGTLAERKDGVGKPEDYFKAVPKNPFSEAYFLRIKQLHDRIVKMEGAEGDENYKARLEEFWRALAIIVRAGLILADHKISSEKYKKPITTEEILANTSSKQPLGYHLTEVSKLAGKMVGFYFNKTLPGITEESIDKILAPTEDKEEYNDYLWQNTATEYLSKISSESNNPTLVFNTAGTGSGKTLMNAKAIVAMAKAGDKPVRFAVALNLRNLTKQTRDFYLKGVGLKGNELVCLIGERNITEESKETERVIDVENDETQDNTVFEIIESRNLMEMPQWLNELPIGKGNTKGNIMSLIGTPVLISTTDYITKAGELGEQGHHARALLRVSSSDLVIDEIDSYNPESIVSVLRIILVAAMFGRNVVVSSATLPEPIALAAAKAYCYGAGMYSAIIGVEGKNKACRIAFIDNICRPSHYDVILGDDLNNSLSKIYKERIDRIIEGINKGNKYRKAEYIDIRDKTDKGVFLGSASERFCRAIRRGMMKMHDNNSWEYTYEENGITKIKNISIGLVRVANITPCVELCQDMSKLLPMEKTIEGTTEKKFYDTHICSYHGSDWGIRRYAKEEALDRLLCRKDKENPNKNLLEDVDILEKIKNSKNDNVIFVVVATPVEEIGRDHDFDWAVIEPSSIHSIIQCVGRVNRHRRIFIDRTNIAILEWNYKGIQGLINKEKDKPIFRNPGNETEENLYRDKSLSEDNRNIKNLLPKTEDGIIDITAKLMFDTANCLFAQKDLEAIKEVLDIPVSILLDENQNKMGWATKRFEQKYPLRDNKKDMKKCFRYLPGEDRFEEWLPNTNNKNGEWVDCQLERKAKKEENTWLCFPPKELQEKYNALESAFEFDIFAGVEQKVDFDMDFGAYRKNK